MVAEIALILALIAMVVAFSRNHFSNKVSGICLASIASLNLAFYASSFPKALPPEISVGFLVAGLILAFPKKSFLAIQFLWLMLFIIAVSIFAGNMLSMMLGIPSFVYGQRWSISIGLLLLSMILFAYLRSHRGVRDFYENRQDRQIAAEGIVIFVCAALIAGLGGAGIMTKSAVKGMEWSIADALRADSRHFAEFVRQAELMDSKIASSEFSVAKTENPNDALKSMLASYREAAVVALGMRDLKGNPVAFAGEFQGKTERRVRLSSEHPTWLVWRNGLYLETFFPAYQNGKKIGEIQMDTDLQKLDPEFDQASGFGESGEVVICAPEREAMLCFPSRLHRGMNRLPDAIDDHALPMSYALRGKSGVTITRDYRGRIVLAAYRPVGELGLGMVRKVDLEELYGATREQLFFAGFLSLLTACAASWLLYRRSHSLVHDLVLAETQGRTILDNIPEAVVTTDGEGSIRSSNASARKIFGHELESGKGMFPLLQGLSQCASGKCPDASSCHEDGCSGITGIATRADGSEFPYEMAVGEFVLGAGKHYVCIVRDLTERLNAEEGLKESEDKLRSLFELSPLGIALRELKGNYVEFNAAYARICGYPAEELQKIDNWMLTPEKYQEDERRALESLENTGRYGPYEKEYRRKDGSLIPVRLNGMLITGRDGRKYVWSIVEDISEAKKAEEALKERERYTRYLLENLETGIVVHSGDGSVKYMNAAARRFFGLDDDHAGKHIPHLFKRHLREDGSPMPIDELPERKVLSEGRSFYNHVVGGEFEGESRPRWALTNAFPDFDENGSIREVIVSFVDISERKYMAEALIKANQKFEHVIETNPAATYIVDLNSTGASKGVNFLSSRICDMVGYSLAHWLDPDFWPGHIHPEDRARVMANQAELFEQGELKHEYRFRHENGSWVWIYDHLVLVRDERNLPVEIIGTWLDITRIRKMAQDLENLNRLYLVLSEVSEATVKVRSRNQLYEDITRIIVESGGFRMAWIGVMDEEEIIPVVHAGVEDGYLDILRKTGLFKLNGPASLVMKTGNPQICLDIENDPRMKPWKDEALRRGYRSSAGFPLYLDGKRAGLINIYAEHVEFFNDEMVKLLHKICSAISFSIEYLGEQGRREEAEEKLREINAELEKRVEQRTRELSEANAELEAFSYSVSHDLRAPLRSIDGFSEILGKKYIAQLDDTATDYLSRVRRNAKRMGELIEDLLQLSKMSRAEIRKEEVDLSRIVSNVTGEFDASARSVEWQIQEGIVVQADPRLMKIAIENLIGNAWKFTSIRDAARIEFGMFMKDDEKIIYVRDNGVGFDMKHAGKLFGAFQRLHRYEEFEGTGIGLATVQRIIKRHGGRIWAEGEVNGGATFYFSV